MTRGRLVKSLLLLGAVASLGACSASDDSGDSNYPDIVGAEARFDTTTETWTIDATISSPYDTAERYADAWRVVGADGTVYGIRELTHGHPDEQPFTRSLSGIEIRADVEEVVIEGRDQVNGYGGLTQSLALHR